MFDDAESSTISGDKEWYFFCLRGRKYRNSIRPNRVTGSGFWKATGIDRPIYSATNNSGESIGLKKSLVYYRGSAGKGTKTDWMMHEFRLPPAAAPSAAAPPTACCPRAVASAAVLPAVRAPPAGAVRGHVASGRGKPSGLRASSLELTLPESRFPSSD